jgi:hypothetical protein
LLSVLVTLLVMHTLAAPPATARTGQVEEVRASAFVLVGADGAELARLVPGPQGAGNLTLFDTAGKARVVLGGGGIMRVFDADGVTSRVSMGVNPQTGGAFYLLNNNEGRMRLQLGISPEGNPVVQLLDANGMTTRLGMGVSAEGRPGFSIRDASGLTRVQLGQPPAGTGDTYEVSVRDAEGNIIACLGQTRVPAHPLPPPPSGWGSRGRSTG